MGMRFAHTNIITDNWKRLAEFYIRVFQCKALLPERDLSGKWLEKATSIPNSHIRGVHLEVPGYESNAPTLEIFQYDQNLPRPEALPNRKGFGHIAFQVDDIQKTLELVLANGGSQVGELVNKTIESAGSITFVYVKDIDGNIVELQNWKK